METGLDLAIYEYQSALSYTAHWLIGTLVVTLALLIILLIWYRWYNRPYPVLVRTYKRLIEQLEEQPERANVMLNDSIEALKHYFATVIYEPVQCMTDQELIAFINQAAQNEQSQQLASIIQQLCEHRFTTVIIDKNELSAKLTQVVAVLQKARFSLGK